MPQIDNLNEGLRRHVGKINPRRNLTAEETKRLAKLEAISKKLQRGKNV